LLARRSPKTDGGGLQAGLAKKARAGKQPGRFQARAR
jgi:hypothetical protein